MNAYQEQGYETRKEYLDGLAEEYGVETDVVYALAGLMGPSEDFDGLITELEDYSFLN